MRAIFASMRRCDRKRRPIRPPFHLSAPALQRRRSARLSTRQRSACITSIGKRRGLSDCTGRQGSTAFDRVDRDFFQRFVVPHLCFSKQSPALEGVKHRALTAQRFHCPVANEVFHCSPPTCPAPNYLKPNS